MPLQSRVTPSGELIADGARGWFMGNRGGRIHDDAQKLTVRRWASKQWICCALDFKGRHRKVWDKGYTELFFLDEVTALAAGHRPCFECRRSHAMAFSKSWERAHGHRLRAPEMDAILHAERVDGRAKRTCYGNIADLPDGAMMVCEGVAFAIRGKAILRWSPAGYAESRKHPSSGIVTILTPPSIVEVLRNGYVPRWHPSAIASG